LFYRIEQKQGKFTFYIFMRAKETVDGNRGVGNEREGEIKGTFLGEKEKKGKGEEVRMGVARRGMARMSGKISGKKKEMTAERNGKQRRFMQYLRERTAVLT